MTLIDAEGRRHSLDVLADSTYDAAHLYFTQAKKDRSALLPVATRNSVFEVISGGRVYRVPGEKLRNWILDRRQEWHGPKGYLFRQRPILD